MAVRPYNRLQDRDNPVRGQGSGVRGFTIISSKCSSFL